MRETRGTDDPKRARNDGPTPGQGVRCPICDGAVDVHGESFPFCTRRCKLVDLGRWLGGGYVVSRPLEEDDFGEV
ncbi:MAG: DNA gyrase inhibitor YacG [Phycisphaeraceae bacterium]|nr:DNA gyrase inhibitor YacG [Phycisphaeraceae bacterium]